MSDRREQARREADVSDRVSLERLRLPIPAVMGIVTIAVSMLMSYFASQGAAKEQTGAVRERVSVIEAKQANTASQVERVVDELRRTNEKLDRLIEIELQRHAHPGASR